MRPMDSTRIGLRCEFYADRMLTLIETPVAGG
jgi:hypothetical protein